MSPKVEQFLAGLPAEKKAIANHLRNLVLPAFPMIEEAIKWNQLTFVLGKSNLAFVYTYATVKYVNLGFFNGATLQDPQHLLEGTGKGMRHMKIHNVSAIPSEQVLDWFQQAVTLAELPTKV